VRHNKAPYASPQQIEHARKLIDTGEVRKRVANFFNVNRTTLCRAQGNRLAE
jgi:hypothetical protein